MKYVINVDLDNPIFGSESGKPQYPVKGFDKLFFDEKGLRKLQEMQEDKTVMVGDICKVRGFNVKAIVTRDNIDGDIDLCHVVYGDGSTDIINKKSLEPTGKTVVGFPKAMIDELNEG